MQFAPGSVVRLKSGGPVMTVDRVTDDLVTVDWFGPESDARSSQFRAASLVPADPPPVAFSNADLLVNWSGGIDARIREAVVRNIENWRVGRLSTRADGSSDHGRTGEASGDVGREQIAEDAQRELAAQLETVRKQLAAEIRKARLQKTRTDKRSASLQKGLETLQLANGELRTQLAASERRRNELEGLNIRLTSDDKIWARETEAKDKRIASLERQLEGSEVGTLREERDKFRRRFETVKRMAVEALENAVRLVNAAAQLDVPSDVDDTPLREALDTIQGV